MFGESRATREAAESIVEALSRCDATMQKALSTVGEDPRLESRMAALELGQSKWEAGVEGILLKAKGQLQAASAAESRARTMERHAEKISPEDDRPSEDGVAPEGYDFGPGDAPVGEEEGLHPLRLDVETSPKNRALRAKFA